MASFSRGTSFTDGVTGDVTAAKLHALVDAATPVAGLVTDRTAKTSVIGTDVVLISDSADSNNLKKVTVTNLANNLPTAVITNGTIATLNSTTGTITEANITTGTVTTLTSSTLASNLTGGTYSGTINSTSGTVATLNSTTGTIATLNSTTATITTGTIPTLVATTSITSGTGTAGTVAISPTGDSNTGIFFPAADTIAFAEGGAEAMRIDSNGRLGIGTTTPATPLDVNGAITADSLTLDGSGSNPLRIENAVDPYIEVRDTRGTTRTALQSADGIGAVGTISGHPFRFLSSSVERARIDSGGNLLFAKTTAGNDNAGFEVNTNGRTQTTVNGDYVAVFNRKTNDGVIIYLQQDQNNEGTISVNGTTVSYNGGHLSRFSQLPTGQRDPLLKKGTVLSNLDAMCEWRDSDGNLLPNEQLNKVKISDIEGDSNVAGVFVNWDNDDQDNPFDLNMAMTGDMIIRIAQGVIVSRGDLLMSAGDGTAKPQGDDIVRSKTIAKVISTNVTCTYDDGSYCVPCVLMAC